jgi:hypothetical protein
VGHIWNFYRHHGGEQDFTEHYGGVRDFYGATRRYMKFLRNIMEVYNITEVYQNFTEDYRGIWNFHGGILDFYRGSRRNRELLCNSTGVYLIFTEPVRGSTEILRNITEVKGIFAAHHRGIQDFY